MKLDEYQMMAVKCMNDAVVVVAGAGSGKTFTIVEKVKYLINELNYKEQEILCISFTNKSVLSLKEKIHYNCDIYTFHKLAIKILNDNYSICNDNYLDFIANEYIELNNLKLDKNLIIYYINLIKSNNLDLRFIYDKYRKSILNKKLYKTIMDIYLIYIRELESSNLVDFDLMLVKAKDAVKNIKLKYKYIIIDEFQDTSYSRFNLILEIIKYTNSKLMVVGDDYQSIYKFNGCKLDIFLNMNKYIKDTKYIYLKYTYRNSSELNKVSISFIMKNSKQLKKEIISNIHINKPIKIVLTKKLEDILDSNNYLIISRNNKDLDGINYDNKMTIHRSKGLECTNVILINSDSIPSKIKTNNLFYDILTRDRKILYEEERRLFYVALTRCKNYIYIMVNKKMSPFVRELIHDYKEYIEII